MIHSKELKLGTKIKFNAEYIRYIKSNYATGEKEWISISVNERQGIIVGLRTIADGTVYYDAEEGNHFIPKTYKKCALVAFDINRKFARVPIENIYLDVKEESCPKEN